MKITKDRIHSWEQVHEKDYEKKFDDELIILLEPDETSKEMGDYILEIQEKAEKYDKIPDLDKVFEKNKMLNKEWENQKVLRLEAEGELEFQIEEKNRLLRLDVDEIQDLKKENKQLKTKLDSIQDDLIGFYLTGLDSNNKLTQKGGKFIRKYVNLVTGDKE